MRTPWEVLMVVSILLIGVVGIANIGEETFYEHGLTEKSADLLKIYSDEVENYTTTYNNRLNNTEIDPYLEPDLNDVDGFVQEYRDYKGKFDQLKNGLKLIYRAPDLFIEVIPFVDVKDMELYANIYRIVIWILLLLLVIVALKNGEMI